MWYDWQPKPALEIQALLAVCPEGEYRIVEAQDVPEGLVSAGLLAKGHSALLLCSGTDQGRVYFMVNLNRLHGEEVDQMPYCIAYEGETPIPSGILIQHGSYHCDRTIPLPQDFHQVVQASGLYPFSTMPENRSGRLDDLLVPSQRSAFQKLVHQIEKVFPG